MEDIVQPYGHDASQSRKSLRLTFRVADGKASLVSYERLDMICPPSIGQSPQAGKHGGFWMELRDAKNRVIFHRALVNPLGDSIEVHSPDGKIQRIFGDTKENLFEVLLPDDSNARTIVFMGESLIPVTSRKEKVAAARELSTFEVPRGPRGGVEDAGGCGQ